MGVHQKPIELLNLKNYYAPLLATMDHAVDKGFIFQEHREALCCDGDPENLLDAMLNHQQPNEAVQRWMRRS
jgi:predicted Rossmann-fold nucleotide-binding protein